MDEEIKDKNGVFKFDPEDPLSYKKARKRLQNRESAVRSRVKKREEIECLEEKVRAIEAEKSAIQEKNAAL